MREPEPAAGAAPVRSGTTHPIIENHLIMLRVAVRDTTLKTRYSGHLLQDVVRQSITAIDTKAAARPQEVVGGMTRQWAAGNDARQHRASYGEEPLRSRSFSLLGGIGLSLRTHLILFIVLFRSFVMEVQRDLSMVVNIAKISSSVG